MEIMTLAKRLQSKEEDLDKAHEMLNEAVRKLEKVEKEADESERSDTRHTSRATHTFSFYTQSRGVGSRRRAIKGDFWHFDRIGRYLRSRSGLKIKK